MLVIGLWFLAGIGMSLLHLLFLSDLVANLDPARARRFLMVRVLSSFAARYVSLVILLALAIRQQAGAGIAAAVGFGLARWVWALRGTRAGCEGPRTS